MYLFPKGMQHPILVQCSVYCIITDVVCLVCFSTIHVRVNVFHISQYLSSVQELVCKLTHCTIVIASCSYVLSGSEIFHFHLLYTFPSFRSARSILFGVFGCPPLCTCVLICNY